MEKPERVLVLLTELNRGGAETMTMNYYRHLDRSKIQYDFLVNRSSEGAYESEIRQLGGRIYRMCPMYPQYFDRYKKEFRIFLRQHPEYRIIHSNLEERSYFPLRIAAEEGVPVRIAHAHSEYHGFDKKTLFREYFKHRLPAYVTQRFSCSYDAGKWLFGSQTMKSGNVSIVQNAIDLQEYSYDAEKRLDMRKRLGLENKYVVGHVGRLAKQKNHTFLLKVFAELRKKRSDAALLLVGDGVLCKDLKQQALRLGVENDVYFVGSVPNVSDYLQAMDVFVFPSLLEGLGMALIEAEAVGLPCIASNAIPEEANVTKKVQYISLNDSAQTWANVISSVEMHDRFSQMSAIQHQMRKANFDIKTEIIKLQSTYLDLLEHSGLKQGEKR